MKRSVLVLAFGACLITMILSVSCSSHPGLQAYPGPKLPKGQLAVLQCSRHVSLKHAYQPWILSVDEFRELAGNGGPLAFDKANMQPGEHTVEAKMGKQDTMNIAFKTVVFLGSESRRVTFTAEAGHTYYLRGDVDEPEYWLWIVDASTDETVGGEERPK